MGLLDSLLDRDSRKFIKRKDSDAGEAGRFFQSCLVYFIFHSKDSFDSLLISVISGIWGCVFFFPVLDQTLNFGSQRQFEDVYKPK